MMEVLDMKKQNKIAFVERSNDDTRLVAIAEELQKKLVNLIMVIV